MTSNGGIQLPEGAGRLAITMNGMENEAEMIALKNLDAVMVFLNVEDGVSRIHASRRALEILDRESITVPVIHHFRSQGCTQEELIINSGSQV